jgi:CRISPR-associated protein Cmr4
MNRNSSVLLFIHAQTSLHPGSGTASGAIDLPVQRERHTGWPLIPGSTIKGVLRDYCRLKTATADERRDLIWADRDPELECVFGPSMKGSDKSGERGSNAADFAGALSFTDARILLFPVRSLCGLFAWVTCPGALDRLRRDLEVIGDNKSLSPPAISLEKEDEAVVASDGLLVKNSPLGTDSSNMVLEEFDFKAKIDHSGLKTFAHMMSQSLGVGRLQTYLAVIHDDRFTHFVKNATEVSARIALNYETKTASDGALFYVETLPPETVFYSLLLADRPKGKRDEHGRAGKPALYNEQRVIEYITKKLMPSDGAPAVLQIGGEASTGKGICRVVLHGGDAQ